MPVADFPGRRGWGYDGVLPYAPDAAYGRPEEPQAPDRRGARARSHGAARRGLQPLRTGRQLPASLRAAVLHGTPSHAVGRGHQFRRRRASRPVRDFFVHNALYWLEEFHADGLRFDAVHAIADDSTPHILEELAAAIRNGPGRGPPRAPRARERRQPGALPAGAQRTAARRCTTPSGTTTSHHAFHVLLTGESDGYYADYAGEPTRLLGRCLAEGFAYQGEPSRHRGGEPRGEPSADLPPAAFVSFLQTHDQVGNRAFGERLAALAEEPALRAATVAWLLAPAPPMLVHGRGVRRGNAVSVFLRLRRESLPRRSATAGGASSRNSRALPMPAHGTAIPDPNDPDTFARSKLDWTSHGAPAARALARALPAAARAAPAMPRAAARRHDGIRGALRGAGCRRARVPLAARRRRYPAHLAQSLVARACRSRAAGRRARALRAGRRGARARRAASASLLRPCFLEAANER